MRSVLAALAASLALGASGADAAPQMKVVLPPPLESAPLPPDSNAQPVTLTRLAGDIPDGTQWLQVMNPVYFLTPCVSPGEVGYWREADNKIGNLDLFSRIFRDELSAAGFRATGGDRNLFEEQKGADLQVGALVKDVKVRLCQTVSTVTRISGRSSMDVEWQLYSVSQGKVIARIATQGGVETKDLPEEGAVAGIVADVFADNVKRLAANAEFRRIVTATAAPAGPAPSAGPLRFKAPPPAAVPLSTAVKSAVLVFAGQGHGSGVLISADGYILTNHHVAGSSGPVRIRWADGSESVGEVVRADPRRDVALIKAAPKAVPLPVRASPAQVGEPVFAVGTPLTKEFANTLTRGVVSATRVTEGRAFIQSDVAVDYGNSGGPLLDAQGRVLALTVSGYRPDGVSHGINFFIPIDDALKALALSPAA